VLVDFAIVPKTNFSRGPEQLSSHRQNGKSLFSARISFRKQSLRAQILNTTLYRPTSSDSPTRSAPSQYLMTNNRSAACGPAGFALLTVSQIDQQPRVFVLPVDDDSTQSIVLLVELSHSLVNELARAQRSLGALPLIGL
jgi:hypothetical protein